MGQAHTTQGRCCDAGAISSLQEQASHAAHVPLVRVDAALCHGSESTRMPSQAVEVHYHDPEEEIALGESSKGGAQSSLFANSMGTG